MNTFEKIIATLSLRLSQIAQVALVAVMLLIVSNIILRQLWLPIPGTVEIVEILGAIILGTSLAYCLYLKGHIYVNVIVRRFSKRKQGIVDTLTNTLSLVFVSLLTWQTFIYGSNMMSRGLATGHLGIPIWPIIYLVGFGFFILTIVILHDWLKAIQTAIKGERQT